MSRLNSKYYIFAKGFIQLSFILNIWIIRDRAASATPEFQPMVTWEHGNTAVLQGEDLTLTCRVTDVDHFTVVRVVHTQGSMSRTVADNYNLKPPYNKISRYSINYNLTDEGIGMLSLNITDAQGEDSGSLHCYRIAGYDNHDVAVINIDVLVPVTDLYMTQITSQGHEHRVKDGDDIVLEENLETGVACVVFVNKTFTQSEIQITIGGNDEMSSFELTNHQSALILESGLSANSITTRAVKITSYPRANFNGKTLKCTALRKAYDPLIISVNLIIMYTPRIVCSRYVIMTSHNDHDVTFDCAVRANPSGLVTWRFDGDTSLYGTELSEDDNFIFINKAILTDTSDVSMTLIRVSDVHFGNYTLLVANDIGQAEVKLALVEKPKPPPEIAQPIRLPNGSSGSAPLNALLGLGLSLLVLCVLTKQLSQYFLPQEVTSF